MSYKILSPTLQRGSVAESRSESPHLLAFLRLIRFARMTALVADILTIFNAVLIVGWQIIIFLKKGSWPALPLSSVFNKLESGRGAIYTTASASEIERSQLANVVYAMLRVPTIVLLLVAVALLTAFYLWLTHTEKRYSGK
jgi:hypothetical protein